VTLLSTDLGAAKDFYGERIGLEILIENDDQAWKAASDRSASTSM
jgi:hypothetical protein